MESDKAINWLCSLSCITVARLLLQLFIPFNASHHNAPVPPAGASFLTALRSKVGRGRVLGIPGRAPQEIEDLMGDPAAIAKAV